MKNSVRKLACMLVCVLSLTILSSCDYIQSTDLNQQVSEQTNEQSQATTNKENENAKTKKYDKKIEWGNLSSYCCAVEIDEYDGDIIEAGTYRVYPDLVSGLDKGRIAIVWDVYTSETLYNNISELKESEYRGSVGGMSKNEITLDLSSGQYLYIKYNPVANNNPTGIIIIDKK